MEGGRLPQSHTPLWSDERIVPMAPYSALFTLPVDFIGETDAWK